MIKPDITIIIPSKNEEENISVLLESLADQDFPINKTKIYLADADSKDNTVKIAKSVAKKRSLNLTIIKGGRPSEARNAGAKLSKTPYLLFIDADMDLRDKSTISKALILAKSKDLDCVSALLKDKSQDVKAGLLYRIANITIRLSKFHKPFSPGAFMLFKNETFKKLGGFDEKVHFSEDYFLTRRLHNKKFGIIKSYVHTKNRRFARTGYLKTGFLFLKTALNVNNKTYFYKDHGYWDNK